MLAFWLGDVMGNVAFTAPIPITLMFFLMWFLSWFAVPIGIGMGVWYFCKLIGLLADTDECEHVKPKFREEVKDLLELIVLSILLITIGAYALLVVLLYFIIMYLYEHRAGFSYLPQVVNLAFGFNLKKKD